jgi:hypothetical protein
MANHPTAPAKNETGDFARFTEFTLRIFSVPHCEIKAKLDAEKAAKRTPKGRASRVSGIPSKPA